MQVGRTARASLAAAVVWAAVAGGRWVADETASLTWELRAGITNAVYGMAAASWSAPQPGAIIPKVWEEAALASMELPIASLGGAQKKYASADYYYRVQVRPVYRTYPVYALGREPAGYKEWLRRQPPEIVFDPASLRTEADWVEAGKRVFHSPIAYDVLVTEEDVANPRWYASIHPPVTTDGVLPFIRYGIREAGKIEVGILSCATCHSRVLDTGDAADGIQGNFRYNAAIAWAYRRQTPEFVRNDVKLMYGLPWLTSDPLATLYRGSADEIIRHEEAMPAGMVARNGTSPLTPTPVPTIIGVQDSRYLDHTGLVQHRTVGDLMRYVALAQGMDFVSTYGTFTPRAEGDPPVLHAPETLEAKRYSDEQLYALAQYVYSLRPPVNPYRDDPRAPEGKRLFEHERCGRCHTPPLYTNNMLMPVTGFTPPPEHLARYRVMVAPVSSDPELALRTRRGTGYYKVPTLRSVWTRQMLGHSGYARTLEDWFDPARLRSDYVATGFRAPGVVRFAVKGHPYGLDLSPSDRAKLIAFLRTID